MNWRTLAIAVMTSFIGLPLASQAIGQGGSTQENHRGPTEAFDHERREVMIPMRDGVRLHTVIIIPKNLRDRAPIILTRTPYGADRATSQARSPRAALVLPLADEPLFEAGYIRVYQDIRGRYGSEGDWIMTRPPRGPLNRSGTDEGTDAWDTIEWLVENVPESNDRVGLTGVSYPGWLTLMGLLDPHPALRAAVPMYPMVDGWMGDDFYHNGAFRQTMFEWIYNLDTSHNGSRRPPLGFRDMYEAYLEAGTAQGFAARYHGENLPTWRNLVDNPTYSAFWSGQAVQDVLDDRPVDVPVLIVHGLFDQEDNFGGIAAYQALETHDRQNDRVYLAIGPWSHGQSQHEASSLGPFQWGADTGRWLRENVVLAFWNRHLKNEPPAQVLPPVLAFDTGSSEWRTHSAWPAGGERIRLHLAPEARLTFAPPLSDGRRYAEYVSDPARPVPYRTRPILANYDPDTDWSRWLVDDQRPFSDRPDVLTFVTEPLSEPLTIAGAATAHLFASTTGTDADWVVKLIDVYPPEMRAVPELGGYQLMVAGDIMRGRYRENLNEPSPVRPNQPTLYRMRLPHANHTFERGHRIMIQVQSSWFPLYDRNPQTFVENIAYARASDYRSATQRIWFTLNRPSFIDLPVLAPSPSR